MTAFVEIVFDNSDGRFPNGADELVLRRTIGVKKDEYTIDRKTATKKEVANMLESAGFSRSNPYYIVPQGRITALTGMREVERLALLKEVAGTQVYESRRQESKKIMQETDSKREKIDDYLKFIGERLAELEEEKEELKGFQEKDRERRCLEHTIYSRDRDEVAKKLLELEALTSGGMNNEALKDQENEFSKQEERLQSIESGIDQLKQQMKYYETEKKQVNEDKKTLAKDKARMEVHMKSLKDSVSNAQENKGRQDVEVQEIQQQIQTRDAELAQILPEYELQKAEEERLEREFQDADGRRQRLNVKQNRQMQFRNKRERDEWLRGQIQSVRESTARRKAVLLDANEGLQEKINAISSLENDEQALRNRIDTRGSDAQTLANDIKQATAERDRLMDLRKDLRREDARLNSELAHAQTEQQKNEQIIGHMMDRNTSRGLQAVRRLVKQHKLEGYYGTFAELFTAQEGFRWPAEITAGNSLFHCIVDTDSTASTLLELLQKEKSGRVTFVPLNRIRTQTVNFPQAAEAIPLIKRLQYDPVLDPAMQQVFGKTIVCPDMTIATSYARSQGLTAITPGGDRAEKKGSLTGGHIDLNRSRLEALNRESESRKAAEELRSRLDTIKQEIITLDQKVTKAVSDTQRAESRRQQADDGYGSLATELRSKTNDIQARREELESLKQRKTNIEAELQRENSTSQDFEHELTADFKKALTDAEDQELISLTRSSQSLRKDLTAISAQRSELEIRKTQLEVELREDLRPRLDQIRTADAQLGSEVTDRSDYEQVEIQLQKIDKSIDDKNNEAESLDQKVQQSVKDLTQREHDRNDAKRQAEELAVKMNKGLRQIEKSASRKAMYQTQAAEVTKRLRDLGMVPEAAFVAPYKDMDNSTALKKFHKVQEELKKFGHVNKKAFEQYNNFTRQQEGLRNRRQELETSLTSITDLIETLDLRKDEAIERTFKQVSREFSRIFERLVPNGKGSLKIQRRTDRRENEDNSEDEAARNSVENYIGVSIQVSFNSKHDEQQKIQQLSGGQKSEYLSSHNNT